MPLPTLLQPGFLKGSPGYTKLENEKLQSVVPIDFIIKFLSDRISGKSGVKPKIKPTKLGDRILILKSSTGSGKSTVLPQYIYTNFKNNLQKNIFITQPRVLNCIDIPSGIIQNTDELVLGKNLGYNTQKFKLIPKEKGVIFCTTEVVSQQILSAETPEDFMKKVSIIMVDEVHTRDLGVDRLLFLMKKLLTNYYDNTECPFLILMSATFDEKIFMEYFDVSPKHYFIVEGFAYEKKSFYPSYDIIDYESYAIKKAMQIHIENLADIYGKETSIYRDILIFIPTSSIGEKMMKYFLEMNCTILNQDWNNIIKWKETVLDTELESLLIKNNNPQIEGGSSNNNRFYILPILLTKKTFEAGGLEYQNMFSSIDTINLPLWNLKPNQSLDINKKPDKFVKPSRRVIICTNIAETGITIESAKYCIDSGFVFSTEFIPDYGTNVMLQKGCTKGMVIQRKGRVGRKSPGQWFPCFTEETFNSMQTDQFADIIISDPTDNLLNIIVNETEVKLVEETKKSIITNLDAIEEFNLFQRNYINDQTWWRIESKNILNIGAMDFLEMPSGISIQYAIEKLHTLGMIDDNYNITLFGYLSNLIRFISIESKRMILGGFVSGASIMDLITIAAFIQTGKRVIFNKNFKMPNLLNKSNFDFIYRMLIADELIGAVLLWNSFNEWITKTITKTFKSSNGIWKNNKGLINTNATRRWCEEHDILYDGWTTLISNRDILIENLINIGINVYYNSTNIQSSQYNLKNILETNLDNGLEEVRKIKNAIYQGYYLNLCEWNDKKNIYMLNSKSIPIQTKSEVLPYLNSQIGGKQTKFKYIIITNYLFTENKTSTGFEFTSSGFISVMDNYVNVDNKLNLA
jgi:HrpA-like RNA helicase